MNRYGKTLWFIALTYGLTWLATLLFSPLGGDWSNPLSVTLLSALIMFLPMTAALVVQKLLYHQPAREPLGISFRLNRWFIAAWLLPVPLTFLTITVSLLLPGIHYDPTMIGLLESLKAVLTPEQYEQAAAQLGTLGSLPLWLILVQGLIAGATINAVAAFGEELGWRGLLQRELGHLGFWRSSVLIGFVWGLWHAPLVLHGHNFPQHPVLGVFVMTLAGTAVGPLISYVRIRSGSVIAAAVTHGVINALGPLATVMVTGGSDLTTGLMGLPGILVSGLLALGLFVLDRRPSAARDLRPAA